MAKRAPDWVPPRPARLLLMGVFLVIASCFDAWMTLEFIARGGEEGNPLVEPYLALGTDTFIAWKTVIGTCAAIALGFGCHLKRWVWRAFNGVIWSYLALTSLHFLILLSY